MVKSDIGSARSFVILLEGLTGETKRVSLVRAAAALMLGTHGWEARAEPSGYRDIDDRLAATCAEWEVELQRPEPELMEVAARTYARRGGFVVRIRRALPESTDRLILAHELAHVLAYNRDTDPPRRYFQNSAEEEALCWHIARHTLLPTEPTHGGWLANADGEPQPVMPAVRQLSEAWRLEPWHVIRRYMYSYAEELEALTAVLWEYKPNNTLEVVSSQSARGVFIPLHAHSRSGDKKHQTPWRALRGDTSVALDKIELGSLRGQLQSAGLPYVCGGRRHVVQLTWLDSRHLSNVERWRLARGEGRRE